MRCTIGFIALSSSLMLSTVPAGAATKVFLLGGQSNMAGVGAWPGPPAQPSCPAPYNAIQTSVHFWNYGPNGLDMPSNTYWPGAGTGWIDLQPGYGWQPGQFGPEVGFGYRLHQLYPHDDIYLVKEGISSQALATSWNPNGGSIFTTFQLRVAAAMNNLTVAGKTPQIAGMIWMQGETDTYGGPNGGADWSAAYSANLTNLINTVRDKEKFGDFAVPDMPFVLGRITTFFGSADNNALVRNAQMTVPGLVGHATWIDTDDLTWAYDGQYGTQGQIDLGIRFANAFATPEPSIFVLAGTGLLALGGYWWRKRRAH